MDFSKLRKPLFLFVLILFFSGEMASQCVSFARNIARPQLEPYVHDGNYNAAYMEEGESAELFKTFFEGEEYRLVVSTVESLPDPRIRLMDENRNVVFDNIQHDFAQLWDFTAQSTGTMILHIQLPEKSQDEDSFIGGCIAILFGVKNSSGRR